MFEIIFTELYFSILDNFIFVDISYLHLIGSGTASFFWGGSADSFFCGRFFGNDFMTLEFTGGNLQNVGFNSQMCFIYCNIFVKF